MNLTIIIPCYNEALNIPLILSGFRDAGITQYVKVLLVNNGSKDNSEEVLQKLLPQYPFALAVKVDENQGYGFGILSGLRAAEAEFIGWTHADMQTDPKDVLKAFEIIRANGYDKNIYVKGSRKGRPLFDNIFTWGMSFFESLYLGKKLWDINAQPNVFHKSFFETWQDPPYDFSLDLYALYMAQKKGLDLIRFDVIFPDRIHGQSNWNTGLKSKYKFIKRTIDFSVKLKKLLAQ